MVFEKSVFFFEVSVLNTIMQCTQKLYKGCVIYLVLSEGFKIMLYKIVSAYFTVTCNNEA